MTQQSQSAKAYYEVFVKHAWGDCNNAGTAYKRKYNKTRKAKGLES